MVCYEMHLLPFQNGEFGPLFFVVDLQILTMKGAQGSVVVSLFVTVLILSVLRKC